MAGRTASSRGAAVGVALVALVATGCGSGSEPAGEAPSGYSTLVADGSVSPVPTSSPRVRCIRAITDTLTAAVQGELSPRRAAASLAEVYGPESPEVRVFRERLPAFRKDAREHGIDPAAALAWPALDAACQ